MKKQCFRAIMLAILVVTAFSGVSSASDAYPDSPIRFIVPFAAGGGSDVFVRTLAPHLGREMGVTFVVENMEGAGTQIGLTALLGAPADGYTVCQANQPHTAFTIAVQKASYKASDFAWVNIQQIDPLAFSVMPDKPWRNYVELVDYIKANPGEIAIGATQMSGPHVFLYYLQEEYDLDFIIVPYSGGGEGRAALLGGHVDAYVGNAFADYSLRDQVRSIAIGWDKRSSLWPDTSTILEVTGDEKLTEVSKALASVRGVLVSRKFKENYPERFEKFVEAYKRAFHSAEHMADAEKTGQTPIMLWTGPEEAEKLATSTAESVAAFAHYFSK